jgi:hypothetical protein
MNVCARYGQHALVQAPALPRDLRALLGQHALREHGVHEERLRVERQHNRATVGPPVVHDRAEAKERRSYVLARVAVEQAPARARTVYPALEGWRALWVRKAACVRYGVRLLQAARNIS